MKSEKNQFPKDELKKIDEADDLHIAPFREDGKTYGTPTWIWAIVVNGNLYVRANNGANSRWYQSAIQQKTGRIHAAGLIKEARFEPAQGEINKAIDEAYKKKYGDSPYLPAMISDRSKAATVKITPQ
jgi:hypothetical protein